MNNLTTTEKSSAVLTDAEIIEGLRCVAGYGTACESCQHNRVSHPDCMARAALNALDLINRQQAEIEWLQKLLDEKCDRCIEKERAEAIKEFANDLYRVFAGHSDYHGDTILTKIICLKEGKPIQTAEPIDTSKIKSSAIKEFAERLKGNLRTGYIIMDKSIQDIIDNLVKEMVGDAE